MIILLEWVDSVSHDGWVDRKEQLPPAPCLSVGLVLHQPTEEEPWWTIAGDWWKVESDDVARQMTIPSACVRKQTILRRK